MPPEKVNDMSIAHAQAQIAKRYPEFSISTIEPHTLGQYNDVFEINGEWIFRFPKFPAGQEQLALETALLQAIGPQLPLPVPQAEMVHLDADNPADNFCGYRKLPGTPFWPETFQQIKTEENRRKAARQLGRFLQTLHHLPLGEIAGAPLPVCDTAEEWMDVYDRIQLRLFPMMRLDACQDGRRPF
jgi:aminoglycoside 2''-phosphotransferase